MHRNIVPGVVAACMLAASTAYAGSGLPRLATLQVGSHTVVVHGDSPAAHSGTNVLTVEVPGLGHDHQLSLHLVGPSGQIAKVQLEPLIVLHGPDEGGHGEGAGSGGHGDAQGHGSAQGHGDAPPHGAAPPASPGTEEKGHAAPGDSPQVEAAGLNARGKTSLDVPGDWKIVVAIKGHEKVQTAEAHIHVLQGGPNRVYLAAMGTLMLGSMAYGAIGRRRQAGGR